jgi:peptidoglycan/LPS O-acetylase OafA/YrhL
MESSALARTALAFSNELVIVIFGLTLVAVACRDLRGDRSILRSRMLVALGDMSYAFYLVHATVLYAILSVVGRQAPGWSNLLWYAGVALVAIAVAAMLHYLIERPVERRMRAWRDARHPLRAIPDVVAPPVAATPAS